MRMDKLTMRSQEALQEAQRLAEKKGNQELQPEHLLWALLSDEEILKRLLSEVRKVKRKNARAG
jgi:ATP-dependent Clp protease ATP-binding subunit ClpB